MLYVFYVAVLLEKWRDNVEVRRNGVVIGFKTREGLENIVESLMGSDLQQVQSCVCEMVSKWWK